MWQFWLIASGIFFIVEIITTGFLIFWLGVAAFITMIFSFFTQDILILATIFLVCSIILIFTTKPFIKKFANNINPTKMNVDALIGKIGIVTEEINCITGTGMIKVSGQTWSAIGNNNINIKKDSTITILKINGVKAVVELKKDNL